MYVMYVMYVVYVVYVMYVTYGNNIDSTYKTRHSKYVIHMIRDKNNEKKKKG